MDKGIAKSVLREHRIPVAQWRLVAPATQLRRIVADRGGRRSGLPLFVKPANLGSSIGVSPRCIGPGPTKRGASSRALQFDDYVILEAFARPGARARAARQRRDVRITAAGEIIASREFYDYEDKYQLGVAKTIVPAELGDAQLAKAQTAGHCEAFRALAGRGPGPGRPLLGGRRPFVVNEVNTMPGFTPISMYPMLWEVGRVAAR